jgi:2,4-dienoyl-CoA reductase-like NADH-dependent reductase (Old Yellow Enzyme family)
VRYLTESFAVGALNRGRPVEQFLGPVATSDRSGVSYVEVRPVRGAYELYVYTVEDVGHEGFFDLIEFPPFDADAEEEDFGRLVATVQDPMSALDAAEEIAGAVRARWVNEGMVQDEYADFVRAGRPLSASPDGLPWPTPALSSDIHG